MTIEVGLLEQAYVDKEASFAVDAGAGGAALSATDGFGHIELTLMGKNNREASPKKIGTPDAATSLARRTTAGFNMGANFWEPSGTLGTVSNLAPFIEQAFGTLHTISSGLATTVAASPAPTATGCTIASATGLAVGDVIVITTTNGREATRVKSIATAAITFDSLTTAPASGAAVVSGSSFKLASTLTGSLSIYKYYNAGGFKEAVYGAVVEQLQATFDGTKEATIQCQGPAARYANSLTVDASPTTAPPQAKPAAHTTVGNPINGMIGTFHVGTAAVLVTSAQVTIQNNLELRNKELGTRYATGIAGRTQIRKITTRITMFMEDTTIFQLATRSGITRQTGVLRLLVGDTNGSMVACVMPVVEFEIPEVGNELGPKEITIEGECYATSGNDGVFFGEL